MDKVFLRTYNFIYSEKPCNCTTLMLKSTSQTNARLVAADVFYISYPCIFNFESTATSIDVSSIQCSFGLLSTLNWLKPGGAALRKGNYTFQHTDLNRILGHIPLFSKDTPPWPGFHFVWRWQSLAHCRWDYILCIEHPGPKWERRKNCNIQHNLKVSNAAFCLNMHDAQAKTVTIKAYLLFVYSY